MWEILDIVRFGQNYTRLCKEKSYKNFFENTLLFLLKLYFVTYYFFVKQKNVNIEINKNDILDI